MESTNALSAEEEAALRRLYTKCVGYCNWSTWLDTYKKFGEAPMGFTWVVLPYKPQPVMPAIRAQMNALYFEALRARAAEYGLAVRIDEERNKLILCAQM